MVQLDIIIKAQPMHCHATVRLHNLNIHVAADITILYKSTSMAHPTPCTAKAQPDITISPPSSPFTARPSPSYHQCDPLPSPLLLLDITLCREHSLVAEGKHCESSGMNQNEDPDPRAILENLRNPKNCSFFSLGAPLMKIFSQTSAISQTPC